MIDPIGRNKANETAAIIEEFGSDAICPFTFEDGTRCLRLVGQCEEMDNPNNPHDEAIPLPHVLEEMRKE